MKIKYMSFDKPAIKNGIIEELFFTVATDYQMRVYNKHIKAGSTALATATASKVIRKWHYHWLTRDIKLGADMEYTAQRLFNGGIA